MNDEIQALLAKQAIREAMYRYCRAMDRMDKELAYSIWHEDGTAHYRGSFEGSGREFVDWVWKTHAPMASHSHQVTNMLSKIGADGRSAVSEAYLTVVLRMRDDRDEWVHTHVCGRYLDRWSQRRGRWALDHRDCVIDLQGFYAPRSMHQSPGSSRNRSDLSWRLFGDAP